MKQKFVRSSNSVASLTCEKLEVYAPLVRNLQILHPSYKFEIAPIVVGAMGYVPKCLVTYLKMVGFEGKDSKLLILNGREIYFW